MNIWHKFFVALAMTLAACTGADKGSASPGAPDAQAGTGAVGSSAGTRCPLLATGRIKSCGVDPGGLPSQKGYLTISQPGDVVLRHVCAIDWTLKHGYTLVKPANGWVADPRVCCDAGGSAMGFEDVPLTPAGYLGKPHAPQWVKPQEYDEASGGTVRQNPFTLTITNVAAGKGFLDALATWDSWAGSAQPHPGPDGTGAYYFPRPLTINYVISQNKLNNIVLTVGPEVSANVELTQPLGHPTMSACAAGGGVPLALIAGVISNSTLNNDSGRFGYDPSITAEALTNAAKIFNDRGILITTTRFLQE